MVPQALSAGQSLLDPQPHAPPPVTASHTEPTLLPTHVPQRAPFEPHALDEVMPVVQSPPLQQPPLQSWVGVQAVTQACVVTSHAWKAGQSVATLHPHAPPVAASPLEMHAAPPLAALQMAHVPPGTPHVPACVSSVVAQVPALQQVPLHACDPVHVVVHWLVARSHAVPLGQSLVCVQPQLPPTAASAELMHDAPAAEPGQTAHVPPGAPHDPGAPSDVAHVPALQHVPLHACPPLQTVVH